MSTWLTSNYPNRVMCEVLEEMRKSVKAYVNAGDVHYNRHLMSLIEEIQTMGNRMEAGLQDARDLRGMHEDKSKLSKEIKKLEAKKDKLKK